MEKTRSLESVLETQKKVPFEMTHKDIVQRLSRQDLINFYPGGAAREYFAMGSFPYVTLPARLYDYGMLDGIPEDARNPDVVPGEKVSLSLYLPDWALVDPVRKQLVLPFYGAVHKIEVDLYDFDELSVLRPAHILRRLVFGARHQTFGGIIPGASESSNGQISFWVCPEAECAAQILVYGDCPTALELLYLRIYAVRHGYQMIQLNSPRVTGLLLPIEDAAWVLNISMDELRADLRKAINLAAERLEKMN